MQQDHYHTAWRVAEKNSLTLQIYESIKMFHTKKNTEKYFNTPQF